ncbi:MAG: hypothetical protein JWP01_2312 [Myxococcales bacterium]|nr:hypothetical protein [Myxococcales bacterium]
MIDPATRATSGGGAARVGAIVAVVALGFAGFAWSDTVLRGGIAWLAFLWFVLSGWGFLVVRAARVDDPDGGLRALWGACGYLAVAGWMLALGMLTRPVVLVLIAAGVAGFAWRELTTPVASWHRARTAARSLRANQGLATIVVVLSAIALLHVLGAVSALDRNPWDDDVAYTPFVKRLLDTGNLIEPFSFRRLGAYGGQTVLQALAGARGSLANVHLIDKGLCFVVALSLLVGYARRLRTQHLWTILVVLVLVLLPDTSINTASYWSGAALLIGLYRTVALERWSLVGLVGAAACTLRQNYIALTILFVGIALLSQLTAEARASSWRESWRAQRRTWFVCAGIALVVIVPYWIAAYRSNGTFLFPYMQGTWNANVSLRATAPTWTDELQFFVWCLIETQPLVILPPLFAVIVFTKDTRRTRPLIALLVANAVVLALMAHSFVGSDANHLWRYAFAGAVTLLAVFALEVGAADDTPVKLVPLGTWVLLASLLLQLTVGSGALAKRYAQMFGDLREASLIDRHGDPGVQAERARYAALQAALPTGVRVAVMLDDPAYLDFRRNQIFNLDTPGYASLRPGMPAFEGPEAVRRYLIERGIRYVAFVRSDVSRYFYRRPFWIWRIFNDAEIFQVMSAYTIDAIDTFASLATTTTVLHDRDGLVALDLGEAAPTEASVDAPHVDRRAAYVRALADREQLHDAWSLNTRDNILFEDGLTGLVFLDDRAGEPAWYEVLHPPGKEPVRGKAARWLYRRAHLRVRGDRDMRLVLRGTLNMAVIHTRPRLDVSLDGQLLASVVADEHGAFVIDVVVPRAVLTHGWSDLYLVFNSISEPQKEVRDLRAARLENVEWEPK